MHFNLKVGKLNASALLREIFTISYDLFKLMIPIVIIVKIVEELGGIKYLSMTLEPLMQWLGLPASMGLVWATTMLIGIYGGMIVFISVAMEPLSVAQATVLGTMMLFAHSLPVEVRIAQKAGVRVIYTLFLRVGGALVIGYILHKTFQYGNFFSETSHAIWQPEIIKDDSLKGWLITQLKLFSQIFLVIAVLVIFLRLLKLSGIEKLMAIALKPLLKLLGLSPKTSSITIIGITLGLNYGGGLLINEAKKGEVSKMDIFGALSLLSICHSLIEDTILIALLGAELSGILYARLLFSIVLISLLVRLARYLNRLSFERYFVY